MSARGKMTMRATVSRNSNTANKSNCSTNCNRANLGKTEFD